MVAALVLACAPLAEGASILYNNIVAGNDTFMALEFSSAGYDGIGDVLGFGSTVQVSSVVVQLYSRGSASSFDATLKLYEAGLPVGSWIASFDSYGNSVAADSYVDVTFLLSGLALPSSTVFLLEVRNVSGGPDIGVELYANPPEGGTNVADTAIVLEGATYRQLTTGGGNPAFAVTGDVATPEPSAAVPIALGLGLCVIRAGRQRRSCQR
jgi:hypothetical protein